MKLSRRILLIILLAAITETAGAQQSLRDSLLQAVKHTQTDSGKAMLIFRLAGYYIYKPGEFRQDLDTAGHFLNQSVVLLKKMPSVALKLELRFLSAELRFERGDQQGAKSDYITLMRDCKITGERGRCAWYWYNFAIRAQSMHLSFPEKIGYFRQALDAYSGLRSLPQINELYHQLLILDAQAGQPMDNDVNSWMNFLTKNSKADKVAAYEKLVNLCYIQGLTDKELAYALLMVNSLPETNDPGHRNYAFCYAKLARVYQSLSMYEQSLKWYDIALREKNTDIPFFTFCKAVVLIRAGRPRTAISAVKQVGLKFGDLPLDYKRFYFRVLGEAYFALHQNALAEKNYLSMISYWKQTPRPWYPAPILDVYYPVSEFYILTGKYAQGASALREILKYNKDGISLLYQSRIQLLLYKIDSAAGKFPSSMSHYRQYKFLSDSLVNTNKNKQIQELQMKYETVQKNRELSLRAQNIKTLTREARFQNEQLRFTKTTRGLLIAGTFLLLLLLGVGYNRFKIKKHLAETLQVTQKEISLKNKKLQNTLAEKDGLILEKEWLIREIHHRVKNNLQIVTSLLNLQTANLENKDAVNAIRESQQRMYALSLIHGKLYQTENVTTIQMAEYIPDLVSFLDNGLNTAGDIIFELRIAEVKLDANQAVPVGLLINEVLTNAIKHAFDEIQEKLIVVALDREPGGHIALVITDNGKGLPFDFDALVSSSLGMSLIRVLTRQLNGSMTMVNDPGLRISLLFKEYNYTDRVTAALNVDMEDIYE